MSISVSTKCLQRKDMGLLDKARVGFKYTQWKRAFSKWADYVYLQSRIPNRSYHYLFRVKDRGPEKTKLEMFNILYTGSQTDSPESVYNYLLEQIQSICGVQIEKEDYIVFPNIKVDDFEKILDEIRKVNNMLLIANAGPDKMIEVDEDCIERVFKNTY